MADNTTLSGGDVIADEDIGGVKYQRTKIVNGTVGSTTPLIVTAGGAAKVDGSAVVQPVSATALPLPTGAATETTLAAVAGTDITTPTAMPAGGVGMRGWLSAIWTKLNGSLAVTGTFFQATQPVSGTVAATVADGADATQGLKADAAVASPYTASGTVIGFLRAIVLALTDGAATSAITATSLPLPAGAATAVKQPAIGTAGSASADVITVQGIANGTPQSIKQIKDTSRTSVVLNVDEFQIAGTTEAMVTTLTSSKASAAPTTGLTSYQVTAGKAFRVTGILLTVSTTTGNTTAIKVYLRVRASVSGTVTTSSPVLFEATFSSSTTAFGTSAYCIFPIPDGLELAAAQQIGVSAAAPSYVATTAAPLVVANILGYEYTP